MNDQPANTKKKEVRNNEITEIVRALVVCWMTTGIT